MSRVSLSAYTPFEYTESKNRKGWVEIGPNNDWPDYLIDLYNESATHHALCNSLAYWIYGKGFAPSPLDKYMFNKVLLKLCIDFKIGGYGFVEVVWNGTTPREINHMPFELIRPAERIGRKIPYYWYSDNWDDLRKSPPREIHLFNPDPKYVAKYPIQIIPIMPFSPGSFYFPKPDYIGAIEYVELEKRIGTFHNSAIKNGLAPSYTIVLPNGKPDPEEQAGIERTIKNQLSGEQNAGSVMIFYTDLGEQAPTIEAVQLNDADKQYQFLSTESSEKIMIGHRVVSPMLFGLKNNTGLGSNADELVQAERIMMGQVINPVRDTILDYLKPFTDYFGFTPNWQNAESFIVPKQLPTPTQPAPAQLSSHEMSDSDTHAISSYLDERGEVIDEDEWELITCDPVDYDNDIEPSIKFAVQLASVPSSNPNGASEQDNELFKVRYGYAPRQTSNSRQFCIKMVAANKVYRKEDIQAAGDRAVNPGFGIDGASTYDIWLYKGGPWCSHYWERKIYLRKNNKKISVTEARKMINELSPKKRDAVRLPVNEYEVAQLPRDMQDHGYYNPQN